jgi:uncharacterized membrane protein
MTSAPMQHDRRAFLLMPLAALVAVLPLIVHGCSCGHDFDFHLLSWIEAANQFSHGNLHPHWAYTPAFNAGEPRFVFYPPISWALGALLGLILTHLPGVSEATAWTAAPILFTWIALTASGLAMHRLARAFATPNAALLAAVLYLANPYMLFTAYERTAYGELLAAVWMPLLLLAILRDKVTIPRIALPLALLWLTNAPAGVMGSYTLALLAAMRVIRTAAHRGATLQLAVKTVGGAALGFGVAAFYIVPAAFERRYVQISMAIIAGMRVDENFLFARTGSSADAILHDEVLHTASVIAVILLIATVTALTALFAFRKSTPPNQDNDALAAPVAMFPVLPLTILTAVIGFTLTPWSAAIWSHAPQAAFLQFPWRLLAVLGAVLALAVAGALGQLRLNSAVTVVMALTLVAALSFPAYHVFRQPCDPEDTATARVALFHSNAGTDPTDEYTPAGADNEALKTTDPPYWLADSPGASAPATGAPGPTPSHITITAAHAEDLILNLRDYPVWLVLLNGATDAEREHRDDGLIALAVPPGASTIDIRYAQMPDQAIGDAITLFALMLLLFTLRRRRTA